MVDTTSDSLENEEKFHDNWASSVDVSQIQVIASNEVCTAPEMRFITSKLHLFEGKNILDVGCGLGEASVYFALKGAKVTSTDLSDGMLRATTALAKLNGVQVTPHRSSAESFDLGDTVFDCVYVGNLFHHVEIEPTLRRIKKHMRSDSILVSWDPLAYNPLINVYRKIAKDTRTPDEHPLTLNDIRLFRKHFEEVEVRCFWLSTLIIFLIMFVAQRRNPNKERFWKKVVEEGERWKWLYNPLEKLDRFLLSAFPILGYLAWNIVVFAKNPKKSEI